MYSADIEKLAAANSNFRRVLYTSDRLQLTLMALKPHEAIGQEKHPADQFFRMEDGSGVAEVGGKKLDLKPGDVLIVPSGMKHNVTAGESGLKLYSLYSPPQHAGGTVHRTKADAMTEPVRRRKIYGDVV